MGEAKEWLRGCHSPELVGVGFGTCFFASGSPQSFTLSDMLNQKPCMAHGGLSQWWSDLLLSPGCFLLGVLPVRQLRVMLGVFDSSAIRFTEL